MGEGVDDESFVHSEEPFTSGDGFEGREDAGVLGDDVLVVVFPVVTLVEVVVL